MEADEHFLRRAMWALVHNALKYNRPGGKLGQGYGLGLILAKSIVEAFGGRITVQSRPGEGSCFTILLPLAGSPQARQAAPQHPGTTR